MEINRSAIKQNAKTIIGTSKPNAILVALVYTAILFILNSLSNMVSGRFEAMQYALKQISAGNLDYTPLIPKVTVPGFLLVLAITIMTIMLSTGFTIYCLNICHSRPASFGNLFDGFVIVLRVLWLTILMSIFVWLWSILLIVPGIIASYRYRMALYIMLENPEMSALECITASKKMMLGRKAELFVLDLSFVGWALLTAIPFITIWVMPYMEITYVNYYLALRDMPYSE
ncbi:MAG: DUF975 family protein [Oscillospiraceae bacterium]